MEHIHRIMYDIQLLHGKAGGVIYCHEMGLRFLSFLPFSFKAWLNLYIVLFDYYIYSEKYSEKDIVKNSVGVIQQMHDHESFPYFNTLKSLDNRGHLLRYAYR